MAVQKSSFAYAIQLWGQNQVLAQADATAEGAFADGLQGGREEYFGQIFFLRESIVGNPGEGCAGQVDADEFGHEVTDNLEVVVVQCPANREIVYFTRLMAEAEDFVAQRAGGGDFYGDAYGSAFQYVETAPTVFVLIGVAASYGYEDYGETVIQGIGEEIGRFFPGAYQEFQIPAAVESIPVYGSQIFR